MHDWPKSKAGATSAQALCQPLAERLGDITAPAMVFGHEGIVLATNQFRPELIDTSLDRATGSHLREVIGGRFAEHSLAIARRVLADGRVRDAVAMWRGHWTRVRYTRLGLATGHVCCKRIEPWRPTVFEAGTAPTPEMLRVHDLGDLAPLSAREAEVLWMIGQGMTLPRIAKALSRSNKTVESHVRTLSAKMNVRGRLALAIMAHERGICRMTLEQVREVFAERPSSRGIEWV